MSTAHLAVEKHEQAEQKREQHNKDQREFRAEVDHVAENANDGKHVGGESDKAVGEQVLHRLDIRPDPRHQAADRILVKVAQRQPHDLGENIGPHVKDDALADPRHHIPVDKPQHKNHEGDGKERPRNRHQPVHTFMHGQVAGGHHVVVDRLFDEQRQVVHQQRHWHDEGKGEQHAAQVRLHVAGHARDQPAVKQAAGNVGLDVLVHGASPSSRASRRCISSCSR